MIPEPVLVERRDGGIVVVTMNNPKTKNALSPEMIRGLGAVLEELNGDASVRAIVITGADGAFCSGGDISRMAKDRQILDSRAWMRVTQKIATYVVNSSKPVIAAVEGPAFGAGMSLAAAADFAVAGAGARFCAAFAKVSLGPDMGLYYTVSQRTGVPQAKRLIMTARVVEVAEAQHIGLVDEVTETGAALPRALELAAELAASAPLTIAVTKAVFADGILTLEDAFRAERDHQPYLFRTEDHQGAVDAFKAKTPYTFKGR
ncbi:Enoyl-CoA hydratase/carnithine racemase [Tropicimonas isoalkanivorans]|uniref:Enoyl-CoA hydratase/carnithine racemase n=2 Tax=Tropicimonas isoalkanivorans TaxID=441112 RepID=A0A1I1HUR8_9RHOB|nr:Enoyl-CoA hydratase/carnithine racemase [Tropicimonas isoalkanivorans]